MASVDTSEKQQSPAVSPKLKACIETSIASLQAWARANGQNWDALTDSDALLWQALLVKSKADIKRGVAPLYPRSDFESLSREGLTGRRWGKFLRWYSREMEADLTKSCMERAEPTIYPGRSSARGGGHPEKSQAIYFLSFDPPPQIAGRSEAHFSSAGAAEREGPPPSEAATSAGGDGPNAGEAESPSERPPVPQYTPSPSLAFLSVSRADGNGSGSGWIGAVALAFVIATAGARAGNPLVDEFLRFLNDARDVLSGAISVRF